MDANLIELEEQLKAYDREEAKQGRQLVSQDEKLSTVAKAYKEAIYQFYKTLFARQMISDFMEDGRLPVEPKQAEMLDYCKRAANAVITKPPHCLITINVRSEVSLQQLIKKVNKFTKRKIVREYIYCYEVRKADLSGLHCHLLCKYDCKPYDLKRNVRSTFKDVCDASHPDILNIKYVSDENLQSKYEYICGVKTEKKSEGVEASKRYREMHNLQPTYSSTPPLSCRGAEYLAIDTECVDEVDEASVIDG